MTTAKVGTPAAAPPTVGAGAAAAVAVDDAAERVLRRVEALDGAALAPLVRTALDRPGLEVTEWHHERISYLDTNAISLGLFRLRGGARDAALGGAVVPWSLVLKVMRSPSGLTLPSGWTYPVGYGED